MANYKSEFEFTRDTHISPYRVSYGVSFVGILKKPCYLCQHHYTWLLVNSISHGYILAVVLVLLQVYQKYMVGSIDIMPAPSEFSHGALQLSCRSVDEVTLEVMDDTVRKLTTTMNRLVLVGTMYTTELGDIVCSVMSNNYGRKFGFRILDSNKWSPDILF